MIARWWRPPRLHSAHQEEEEEREVTWLELFYDLVYVATLIQLGNRLSSDISPSGFVGFVLLFVPIWWSWSGMTFYVNRFIADDVWHRLLVFVQMFAIAALAVNVQSGLEDGSRGFAFAYVGIRLVLIIQYVRASRHVESARPLTTRYVVGFSLAALIWFVSAFVPTPARFVLWVIGMAVDFGTPLSPASRRLVPLLPPDVEHMAERYGLFTIIVLGESFLKVVDGAAGSHLTQSAAIYGALGLAVASSLWWIYFDDTARSQVRMTASYGQLWIYAHLPMTVGLTAFGVSMKKFVLLEAGHGLPDNYRWLICGSVAIYLAATGLIDLATVRTNTRLNSARRAGVRLVAATMVILLAVFGGELSPTSLIALVAAVSVAQVVIDLLFGSQMQEEGQMTD